MDCVSLVISEGVIVKFLPARMSWESSRLCSHFLVGKLFVDSFSFWFFSGSNTCWL